jgi:hypothetical protein
LTNISELTLDRDCCDLRNEKCNEVNGFGFGLSTTDPIYVKIELSEVRNASVFFPIKIIILLVIILVKIKSM